MRHLMLLFPKYVEQRGVLISSSRTPANIFSSSFSSASVSQLSDDVSVLSMCTSHNKPNKKIRFFWNCIVMVKNSCIPVKKIILNAYTFWNYVFFENKLFIALYSIYFIDTDIYLLKRKDESSVLWDLFDRCWIFTTSWIGNLTNICV